MGEAFDGCQTIHDYCRTGILRGRVAARVPTVRAVPADHRQSHHPHVVELFRRGHPGASVDPAAAGEPRALDVEAEQHHVTVLNDIFLAFRTQLAGVARACLASEFDEVFEGDRLGADETALEVGVDLPRGLGSFGALVHRPRAGFLGTGGEERD